MKNCVRLLFVLSALPIEKFDTFPLQNFCLREIFFQKMHESSGLFGTASRKVKQFESITCSSSDPTFFRKLPGIVFQFRQETIFYQLKWTHRTCNLLLAAKRSKFYVFFDETTNKPNFLEHLRLVFEALCSPISANFTIQTLSYDNSDNSENVIRQVLDYFYIDNLIFSAGSIRNAIIGLQEHKEK